MTWNGFDLRNPAPSYGRDEKNPVADGHHSIRLQPAKVVGCDNGGSVSKKGGLR